MIKVTAIRKANANNPTTGEKIKQIEISLSDGRKSVLLFDKEGDFEAQYQEIVRMGKAGELNSKIDVRPSEYGTSVYTILSKKEYSDEVIFGE